jgi:hypothetical protein
MFSVTSVIYPDHEMNEQKLINFAKKHYQVTVLQMNITKEFLESIIENNTNHNLQSEITQWVFIDKISQITGLSVNGIRNRISRREWVENIHYRRENPSQKKSRLIFNIVAINNYLSGK